MYGRYASCERGGGTVMRRQQRPLLRPGLSCIPLRDRYACSAFAEPGSIAGTSRIAPVHQGIRGARKHSHTADSRPPPRPQGATCGKSSTPASERCGARGREWHGTSEARVNFLNSQTLTSDQGGE